MLAAICSRQDFFCFFHSGMTGSELTEIVPVLELWHPFAAFFVHLVVIVILRVFVHVVFWHNAEQINFRRRTRYPRWEVIFFADNRPRALGGNELKLLNEEVYQRYDGGRGVGF